jgi:predicted nucleic acid-binding protein
MPGPPIFLDSSIFLYAVGREHPLRDPCLRALDGVEAGTVAVATSSEVVQEILHVLSRRELRTEAVQLARWALDLVSDVLPVRREELALACELMEESSLNSRDAVHVATMRLNGLTEILTADRHFASIQGVRRLDPATWVLA